MNNNLIKPYKAIAVAERLECNNYYEHRFINEGVYKPSEWIVDAKQALEATNKEK